MNEAAAFYHRQLLEARTPEAQAVRKYVASRGLTAATVERFGLGYAPDRWDVLLKHLRSGATLRSLQLRPACYAKASATAAGTTYFGGGYSFPSAMPAAR